VSETTSIAALRSVAAKLHTHARDCKKSLDDCMICQRGMEWFGELNPQVLSLVLEEVKVVE